MKLSEMSLEPSSRALNALKIFVLRQKGFGVPSVRKSSQRQRKRVMLPIPPTSSSVTAAHDLPWETGGVQSLGRHAHDDGIGPPHRAVTTAPDPQPPRPVPMVTSGG